MPTPVQGRACLIQIQRAGTTDWQSIAYETQHGLNTNSNVEEVASKRGNVVLNTSNSASIPISGIVDRDPGALDISGDEALDIQYASEQFRFRQVYVGLNVNGDADLSTATFRRGGIGSLSGYTENAETTGVMTWSATINVSGLLYKTESEIPDPNA